MTPLKYGMVGGGEGAFIGAVHRMAAELDHQAVLTAGAMSSTPEKAVRSARALGLADDRCYPTWRAMLDGESKRRAQGGSGGAVDFVVIVTPNHVHAPVAKAFVEAGFDVVCDKPLCLNSAEAAELVAAVKKAGTVFAVTYNYSGYPLVKQARAMVREGKVGVVRKVIVEYNQGWLATALEQSGQKQADWRTDPARSGAGGAIGDIGSHAEHLVRYVTALEIESICADLTTFVPGRKLDDDANVLLRFKPANGAAAKGILTASQVCVGEENALRLRVYGEKGGLIWHQEDPNRLVFKPLDGPEQVYRRGGAGLGEAARGATRLPAGHPEAFIEAFANVYRAAIAAIRNRRDGTDGAPARFDYPGVADGAMGVRFIERVVESSRSDRKWTGA